MAKNATKKKVAYAEPDDFFPKEIRKKYKLGEYAETKETKKTATTKKTVKRTK